MKKAEPQLLKAQIVHLCELDLWWGKIRCTKCWRNNKQSVVIGSCRFVARRTRAFSGPTVCWSVETDHLKIVTSVQKLRAMAERRSNFENSKLSQPSPASDPVARLIPGWEFALHEVLLVTWSLAAPAAQSDRVEFCVYSASALHIVMSICACVTRIDFFCFADYIMEILVIQIILAIVTFLVTLLCLMLPLKVFPRQSGGNLGSKSQRILSLSNCVSGGVFLGVCFVGLIPFVRDKFDEAFASGNILLKYPVTEVVVVAGFFLVLATEQSVRSCKRKHGDADDVQMMKYPMEYFSYSEDDSTGSDDSESEAQRRNLKKSQSSSIPLLPNEQTPNGANTATPSSNSTPTKPPNKKRNRVTIRTQKRKRQSAEHSATHTEGGHHGHSHSVDLAEGFSLRAAIMLLALSIHSLFEGMAVGLQDDFAKLINLFISVLVHECLVCFAVGISLAKQNAKMGVLVKLSLLFCTMIPVGIFIGLAIGGIHNFPGYLTSAIIQALAAGTFLYVVFMETLPVEFESDQDSFIKVVLVIFGFILMACLRAVTVHD